MRASWVVWLVLLVPPLGPTAEAQEPVASCSRQCDPRSPDVNKDLVTEGPVNVLLYLHMEDLIGRGYINAQRPNPLHEKDINAGIVVPIMETNTTVCRQCDLKFANNAFEFQVCGPLIFSKQSWNADCGHDPTPGLHLGPKGTILLYWYMSANAIPPNQNLPPSPARVGVMPQVGVAATLNTGFIGRGPMVAESEGPSPTGGARTTMISRPGTQDAYEFRVPMAIRDPDVVDVLERHGKSHEIGMPLHLRVEFYQIHMGRGSGNQFAQSDWRVRTGPAFMPRLVVPIQDPLRSSHAFVEGVHGAPAEAKARFGVFSALGAYDADRANHTFQVEGPGGAKPRTLPPIIVKQYDGHSYPRPLNFTFPMNFSEAPAGEYRLRFSVPNGQGTYRLESETTFAWMGMAEPAPGPGLWGILAMAVCVALLRRRAWSR